MGKEHYTTPTKAYVKGTIKYLEKKKIRHRKEEVFEFFDMHNTQGYRAFKGNSARRLTHDPTRQETRGRKAQPTTDQIEEMEKILDNEGLEGRGLDWAQLGMEVGCEVSGRTISRLMTARGWKKCLACQRAWVSPRTAARRLEWCRVMLERYPRPEDWLKVRFGDEAHFGYGPQHKLRIIRRVGERYRPDAIQRIKLPAPKDEKRLHCWAAVGYDFKSAITFYDVPTNSNGKMSKRVYIDQILEPVVKPWIATGQDFVLEEDGDSGHGTGKQDDIVKAWKTRHCLKHYFNAAASPDLSPIENCWQPTKQHLKKYPHWDESTTKQLILDGWDTVTQSFINERILSMPSRLQDVINSNGQLCGH